MVIHLQVIPSVNPPPIKGPVTEAIPNTEPKIPWNAGRFRKGIIGIVMIMTPEKTPAPPRPAIARPTIKAMEFGATPQIRDPSSKTKTLTRNTLVTELVPGPLETVVGTLQGLRSHSLLRVIKLIDPSKY